FSKKINISKDRQFSKAHNIAYWLKQRNPGDTKWQKPTTGLKPTGRPLVYFGDIPKKKNGKFKPQHLLLFRFSSNAETLTIDLYHGFYTNNREELRQLIQTIKT